MLVPTSKRYTVGLASFSGSVHIKELGGGRLRWERILSLEQFFDLLGEMQILYQQLARPSRGNNGGGRRQKWNLEHMVVGEVRVLPQAPYVQVRYMHRKRPERSYSTEKRADGWHVRRLR